MTDSAPLNIIQEICVYMFFHSKVWYTFQLVVSLRRRQLRARRSPRPVAQVARRRDAGLPGKAVYAKANGDLRSESATGELS